jgi:hypothetical protein
MSGGAGGGRRGGGGTEEARGQAKVTRRRCFGAAGSTLAERQVGWRDNDNLAAAAFGGRPLRSGSAACTSCGAWQGLSRCVETVSTLVPIWSLKKWRDLSRTRNGPSYNSSLGRYVFGSEISYNKAPPRLPGLGC